MTFYHRKFTLILYQTIRNQRPRMQKSIQIVNKISELNNLENLVDDLANDFSLSASAKYNLNLILEEALSNIIFYGFEEGAESKIEIELEDYGNNFILKIGDYGKPFNPLTVDNKAHETLNTDTKIGGLGLVLIKKLSKKLDYSYKNNMNLLTIII